MEPLNERKDLSAHVVQRSMRLVMDQFILEDAEEAFRHGIVVAVPFAAHAQCRLGDQLHSQVKMIRHEAGAKQGDGEF